jgi:HK97 family phage prohead protease
MTKKRKSLEVESIACTFALDSAKSDFESGRFTGIASVFASTVDTTMRLGMRTRIAPGAFLKTINDRGSRVKILSAHDQNAVWIGLPTELRETDEGLVVTASLNNSTLGKDTAEAIRHADSIGRLDAVELSIGFDVLKEEMIEEEDDEKIRLVTELRLWEISVVPFGADRSTRLIEAASLEKDVLLPKHKTESYALSLAQYSESLVETLTPLDEHIDSLTPLAKEKLTDAYERLHDLVKRCAEPPIEALTQAEEDALTLEIMEAELVVADLGVQ